MVLNWDDVFSGVLEIMENATFVQFLYEETIQTALMGAHKAWSEGWETDKEDILSWIESYPLASLKSLNSWSMSIALYSYDCFKHFIKACEFIIEAYRL